MDITNIHHPEDYFGKDAALKDVERIYREDAMVYHPDRGGDEDQFKALNALYEKAKRKLKGGTWGKETLTITSKQHTYHVSRRVSGDLCDVFASEEYVLKIVRNPRNNDLMRSEAKTLQTLEGPDRDDVEIYPTLVESFMVDGRMVNAFQRDSAWRLATEAVRGIDRDRHAAWMTNRMLSAIAHTHDQGYVHGCIIPPHLLVRAEDHGGMLIDWCYSVKIGQTVKATSPVWAEMVPPEILAKKPVTPAADIYMVAKTARHLYGHPIHPKIDALLNACTIPNPSRRYQNAWDVFGSHKEVLRDAYGRPTFVPLT